MSSEDTIQGAEHRTHFTGERESNFALKQTSIFELGNLMSKMVDK